MDSLENSKILKLLGLDDKNKWILQDEKAQKILEYIANNLDEENILTDSEIQEYEKLMSAGLILENEELENELKNIEINFPGFFSVTDDEINELEEYVGQLEAETNERAERIARMTECEEVQLKEIAKIEKENQDILVQQQLYINECVKESRILTNLQKSNLEKVSQLNQLYLLPQTSPTLIYQMPLDQYFHKCNQLLGMLEIYMRDNFKIKRFDNEDISDEEENLIRTIYDTKKEILDVERKKFEEELNVAGMNYIIDNLDKFNKKVSTDYHEMRSFIDEMVIDKENLEAHLAVLQQEGQMLVEQVAEHKIVNLLHEFYQEKKASVIDKAEKINKVHELTDSMVFLCEMLWVGIHLDLERLKNRVDNSDEMNFQAQECFKRINKMKQLASCNPALECNQQFLEQLQNLLIKYKILKLDQIPTIDKCISEYLSYEENLHGMTQLVLNQKHFSKINHVLKIIDDQAKIFRKFIFSGPTNKPCLYDSKFVVSIHDKKQKRKYLDQTYQELMKTFKNNIFEPFNNDKYHRMKVLLFIWFCSDQRKVILAIKEVQKKAAEEGGASYRALNITVT